MENQGEHDGCTRLIKAAPLGAAMVLPLWSAFARAEQAAAPAAADQAASLEEIVVTAQ